MRWVMSRVEWEWSECGADCAVRLDAARSSSSLCCSCLASSASFLHTPAHSARRVTTGSNALAQLPPSTPATALPDAVEISSCLRPLDSPPLCIRSDAIAVSCTPISINTLVPALSSDSCLVAASALPATEASPRAARALSPLDCCSTRLASPLSGHGVQQYSGSGHTAENHRWIQNVMRRTGARGRRRKLHACATAEHGSLPPASLSNSMVMRNEETGEIVWQSDKW